MAKGKYGARAANRLAQLDEELIADERNKIKELEREVAELTKTLKGERRQRSVLADKRSQELAASIVDSVRAEAARTEADRVAFNHYVAKWLVDYFVQMEEEHPGIGVVPMASIDLITKLVGNDEVGQYISELLSHTSPEWANRHHRRFTGKQLRRNQAVNRSNRALNGDNPLVEEISSLYAKSHSQ